MTANRFQLQQILKYSNTKGYSQAIERQLDLDQKLVKTVTSTTNINQVIDSLDQKFTVTRN